jgi:heavy metal sensor kinase
MSLRARVTLFYTALLGVMVLIFGALAFQMTTYVFTLQVDSTLRQATSEMVAHMRVNPLNPVDPLVLGDVEPTQNLLVQIWGPDGKLLAALPSSLAQPLDASSMSVQAGTINSVSTGVGHLRVMSVPLKTPAGDPLGVLQIGISLYLVDATQRGLAIFLVGLSLLTMLIGGLAIWVLTSRALSPLATVTRVATQITKADDLSKRIPMTSSPKDEVGQLVTTFNETLGRLENLFNAQKRFVADVSHELRTPLTVIKGNVSLLRRMQSYDDDAMASIDSEVDRMSRMVGDLLLISQAESGKLPLDMKPAQLDAVLMEVVRQMHTLASDKLTLKVSAIDQVSVMGDHDRLKQVFINLIGNAIQYTQPGGVVSVALRKLEDRAEVIVSDNGPGIPAEDLAHIFERFYRGEKSRTHSGDQAGSGLGLPIAYWIVSAHGGTIEVSSQEGKGTSFFVFLPLMGGPEPSKSEPKIRAALPS